MLSKYELANWIGRLGPEFAKDLLKASDGEAIARHPWETRVRLALAELGPTFIKLGPTAEHPARRGRRGPGRGPPAAPGQRAGRFAGGGPGDDRGGAGPADRRGVRRSSTARPMASASIGQVHRARLTSGEAVVVKVQHADIRRKVAVDLDILAGLAQLAERIPEFQNYRPRAVVAEFQRVLSRELDFRRELRNMQQFARDFANNPTIRIPRCYPELSTGRVLTMELIEGIKLAEADRLVEAGLDLHEVARRGPTSTWR